MRGDVVFRVYGMHAGRDEDFHFGTFRLRAEADAEIERLRSREMYEENWAARYHDLGFVVREHVVTTDFEIPPRPKPRDRYALKGTAKPIAPGAGWVSTLVEVCERRGDVLERVCEYERNYSMLGTFEPFRQGERNLALISPNYTRTAVLDLASGEIIAEETESSPGAGFCPVGFYVPDWWDVHDGSMIPGSKYWDDDLEWPTGTFGFVWGCYWGDDTSWKVQHLDLRRVQDGIIARDDRFGYVRLASAPFSPCFDAAAKPEPSAPPTFIDVIREEGVTRVRFGVELGFDFESGHVDEEQVVQLSRRPPPSGSSGGPR